MNRVEQMKKIQGEALELFTQKNVIMERTSLYHRYKSYNNDYYTHQSLHKYQRIEVASLSKILNSKIFFISKCLCSIK